ncbi:hypothetical protein AAXB25_15055 [Paenibacillus lautus]|uniref:hypothetical protein n=1 Tax=Paenibacillus lautus TaxID=1401 RepID=UPI003D279325
MNKKMCEDNQELAEYIANHLPISSEDALDFVVGALNGGMFTDKVNFTMALGHRDRIIRKMNSQLSAVRSLLERHNI